MYNEYADASSVPVIIYNVPGRTGVNIQPSTYAKLAEHENIVAIKEANNDIASITETMSLVQGKLDLYSGNDDQIVPLLSVGGIGVISVLSNVAPRATHDMVAKFMEGDVAGACELQLKYRDLVKWLFCEVNPIPVKAAVEAMGFCENYLRSPLYPMEDANRECLLESMRNVGLID
jgi:4-hydroxy-tetrahydrodipicolinate synthase